MQVIVSIGAIPSISVSGPANVVPLVLTTVRDNVLTITLKDSVIFTKPVKVVITKPSLQAVDLSGSGSLNASGISGDSLNLNVSGSGRKSVWDPLANGEIPRLKRGTCSVNLEIQLQLDIPIVEHADAPEAEANV